MTMWPISPALPHRDQRNSSVVDDDPAADTCSKRDEHQLRRGRRPAPSHCSPNAATFASFSRSTSMGRSSPQLAGAASAMPLWSRLVPTRFCMFALARTSPLDARSKSPAQPTPTRLGARALSFVRSARAIEVCRARPRCRLRRHALGENGRSPNSSAVHRSASHHRAALDRRAANVESDAERADVTSPPRPTSWPSSSVRRFR